VRSRVVQRETLGRLADDMGLTELIQSNLMGKTHNSYMAGNAFEALIGAVYLDRGYEFCVKFVNERILGKYINLEKIASKESNFKSRFLELCQKYRFEATFELLKETREEETLSPLFLSRVTIYGIECGRGSGYSKKESHQMAAKEALARLNRGGALYKKIVEKQNTIHNVTNSDNSTNICEQTQSIG
jgi:ribonuclease-3